MKVSPIAGRTAAAPPVSGNSGWNSAPENIGDVSPKPTNTTRMLTLTIVNTVSTLPLAAVETAFSATSASTATKASTTPSDSPLSTTGSITAPTSSGGGVTP